MPLTAEKADEPRFLISDLLSYLENYLPPNEIREVYRAYLYGADAHVNQKRLSGEPYIYHPIAVAHILASMRLDYKCLMAAILHDVIEDTPTAKEQLSQEFGQDVAELVDGVTKLTHLDFSSKEEAQAASFRKMILAMTRDIRVILIKLADRLHNMRTLGVMRPEKARRIARETMEIYAPIAQRLGINRVRQELEDLAFRAHWPWRYRLLKKAVQKSHGAHKEMVKGILANIRRQLMHSDIKADVLGRTKNLYSIYRKMRDRKVRFSDMADVLAFRIMVDSVDECYRVLGVVHHLYKPKPGFFKDYIAIPKSNGYQSLHTVLFGPHGGPIEVQIRTHAMHQLAENGVAAHWGYKNEGEDGGKLHGPSAEWLKNLQDLQEGSSTPIEFLEHVKVDLFPDEVYVFTPKGKILVLPRGATVLDFAYAVHTDVGNHCVAARVNKQLVPLRYQLRNGETVEIQTSSSVHPNPRWLEFVVTSKARANIRSFLKHLKRQEAVNLGAYLLGTELEVHGVELEQVDAQMIEQMLADINYKSLDDLLADIGLGNRPARFVARQLTGDVVRAPVEPAAEVAHDEDEALRKRVAIKGTEGMVVHYARCCHPIPGDPIIGIFNPGKGLVVHRTSCPNLSRERKNAENWVEVQWEERVHGDFAVGIRMEVRNRPGVLATTASIIAENQSNIERVHADDNDGYYSVQDFVITVKDRQHLARIMRSLRTQPAVIRISRNFG
ncbi:MAG: bifunctional (p)ppGpp synthetase/guanosine-3',5'-bis(diphosphate) 3'-pyrophosphohydrolase [Gammaproteobacteria bacterium]